MTLEYYNTECPNDINSYNSTQICSWLFSCSSLTYFFIIDYFHVFFFSSFIHVFIVHVSCIVPVNWTNLDRFTSAHKWHNWWSDRLTKDDGVWVSLATAVHLNVGLAVTRLKLVASRPPRLHQLSNNAHKLKAYCDWTGYSVDSVMTYERPMTSNFEGLVA